MCINIFILQYFTTDEKETKEGCNKIYTLLQPFSVITDIIPLQYRTLLLFDFRNNTSAYSTAAGFSTVASR